jgi:hypothetical protein
MSGRKNFVPNYHLTSAQSMASTFTSNIFNILGMDNIFVQMNCTGTPTGTFAIQVSADHKEQNGQVVSAGNFISLSLPQTPTCAGSAVNLAVNIQEIAAAFLQVVYTQTGGTGVCDIWISAKMI